MRKVLLAVLWASFAFAAETPFYPGFGPFRCDAERNVNGVWYPACAFYNGFNEQLFSVGLDKKITAPGRLGVGAAPQYMLDVTGNIAFNAYVRIKSVLQGDYSGVILERDDGQVSHRWAIVTIPGTQDLAIRTLGWDPYVLKYNGGNVRHLFNTSDIGVGVVQVGGPMSIAAGSAYYVGTTAGLTQPITVKGSDGNNCTITVTGGIITGSTCP